MAAPPTRWWSRRRRRIVFRAAGGGFQEPNIEVVEAALSAGFPSTILDSHGNTLLHQVVRRSKLHALVPRMLENNWCPNARNKSGMTPVSLACSTGKIEIVQILVQAGGLLDCPNKYGETAMFYALWALRDSAVNKQDVCALLTWLSERPEVDWFSISEKTAYTMAGSLGFVIVGAAQALQRQRESRWSPLRAAFVGAVAGCAV